MAAARLGMANGDIRIVLPGGTLTIARDARGHVIMTGPIELEYESKI